MQKRIVSLVGFSFIVLAACSGGTPTDDVLPTLAQLPTAQPTLTAAPPTMTPLVATDQLTQTAVPTSLQTETTAETTASIDAPDEPTATLLPIPDANQPSIFPTLVAGEDTTLQGQMTLIDDTHATLTDSQGSTATVLIDPFAAQIGANQLVRIKGTVEFEGDKLVVRMSEITVLNEATPEATGDSTG